MSLRTLAITGAALLSIGLSPAIAQSVVYSDTKGKPCRQLRTDHELSEFQCMGPAGQRVVFTDMGLMFGVMFGAANNHQPPFRAGDGSIGNKIEWRLNPAGQPYAAIYRAFVGEEPQWPQKATTQQVLVVTKIDGERACHIAYVSAHMPKANARAADIADGTAESFRCGTDTPLKVGNPRPFVGDE